MRYEKSPRAYAFDFINAKTDEARRLAVAGCPDHLQSITRTHINLFRGRIRGRVHSRTASIESKSARLTELERIRAAFETAPSKPTR